MFKRSPKQLLDNLNLAPQVKTQIRLIHILIEKPEKNGGNNSHWVGPENTAKSLKHLWKKLWKYLKTL